MRDRDDIWMSVFARMEQKAGVNCVYSRRSIFHGFFVDGLFSKQNGTKLRHSISDVVFAPMLLELAHENRSPKYEEYLILLQK